MRVRVRVGVRVSEDLADRERVEVEQLDLEAESRVGRDRGRCARRPVRELGRARELDHLTHLVENE